MHFHQRLAEFNRRGLIHAPDESDENFFRRCRHSVPISLSPRSPLAHRLFDIECDWVWIVYENEGLRFWEGGCTWIEQESITLQLNKAFEKKTRYFGYTRDEVIAHELVHVARSGFEEPIFEEILAYQTASSPLRRYLGPFFRTATESFCFVLTLATFVATAFFDLFQLPMLIGFVSLIGAGFFRLFRAQRLFSRTRNRLAKLVGTEKALPIMLRLTDREIIRFSQMKEDEILAYAQKMAKIQMRWQQIAESYFQRLLITAIASVTVHEWPGSTLQS